jgi:hypothetical protein
MAERLPDEVAQYGIVYFNVSKDLLSFYGDEDEGTCYSVRCTVRRAYSVTLFSWNTFLCHLPPLAYAEMFVLLYPTSQSELSLSIGGWEIHTELPLGLRVFYLLHDGRP